NGSLGAGFPTLGQLHRARAVGEGIFMHWNARGGCPGWRVGVAAEYSPLGRRSIGPAIGDRNVRSLLAGNAVYQALDGLALERGGERRAAPALLLGVCKRPLGDRFGVEPPGQVLQSAA